MRKRERSILRVKKTVNASLTYLRRPETAVQGDINTILTATIMTAAIVILADSIRRWFGMGKRPESLVTLVEAESAT